MKDKHNLLSAVPGIMISVLMLLTTQIFAPACGLHSDGTYATCHYAQIMVLGLGILILLSVLSLLLCKDIRTISYILLCEAVLLLLTPKVILPLCKMSSMKCLKGFYPSVIIFGIIFILYALVLFGLSFLKPRKKREA